MSENNVNKETDMQVNLQNNSSITNNKQEVEKKKEKKKKSKELEDEYILAYPEKAKTFKAKIENCIMLILKDVDIINEKDLIVKLIFECEAAKEYYKKTNDVGYLRIILWKMTKKGLIKRAKILGDGRRRYYFLPEKIDVIKDRIIKVPKE
ncbi:hypothetical protein [Saccharolobus shibatae]|uniref:Transcriptional regulator, wHTH n=1 Tax=Saccharolobus shibatae TaxID=2286 RepID=A0A8F5BRW1_9CREN|nr:hypothetical protein [Saccharolobus shibatae]QXJ30336.1 Transcriptional regulator, wHTH [Saccharolobus shibatae]QXJ30438.1 Transcriptional regulator, wHTH [Saccharolobus shibatae]